MVVASTLLLVRERDISPPIIAMTPIHPRGVAATTAAGILAALAVTITILYSAYVALSPRSPVLAPPAQTPVTSGDDVAPGSVVHDVTGTLREAACPSPGPACPSPTTPACRNGRWVCIGPAEPAGSAVAPASGSGDAAEREQACSGDVAPGCESPLLPVCRNGRWTCVGPAEPSSPTVTPEAEGGIYSY
jgi:hypothetical protein